MLRWLAQNYHAKIVLVVRHPSSVISSGPRLTQSSPKHTWGFDNLLRQYRTDVQLREDYLQRYDSVLQGPLTPTSAVTDSILINCNP